MNDGYLLTGLPMGRLLRLLRRGGLHPHPRRLLRLFFLLQGSAWTSLLNWRERRVHGKRIAAAPVPDDPVIIVGHWRTGSTWLHQLMSCDPRLRAPTLYDCIYPDSLFTARRYVEPLMRAAMGSRRPMDNVVLGLDEPQEDEWASFRMSGISPMERFLFPRQGRYFLLDEQALLSRGEELVRWEQALRRFVAKLQLASGGRRVLLKNPFHSLRIPILERLFPRARYVHILRDPRRVVPSTVHMWSVVGRQNAMRAAWRPPRAEEVAQGLDRLLRRCEADLAALPSERWTRLRFEDLERDPLGQLRGLYERLGLELAPLMDREIGRRLAQTANFRKNRYPADELRDAMVRKRLGWQMERDGYG